MDEAAFDEFYQASFAKIAAQVYATIGDRDEAQECVQEAFARAWARRKQLDRAQHPEAWVRTTAYRYAVSRWRRRTRARRPRDRALSPELASRSPGPEHVAVLQALRQLSGAQRRAIVLYHLCDLTVREIAEETGAAEGTVKARLSRGRGVLADLLADPHDLLTTRDPRGAREPGRDRLRPGSGHEPRPARPVGDGGRAAPACPRLEFHPAGLPLGRRVAGDRRGGIGLRALRTGPGTDHDA